MLLLLYRNGRGYTYSRYHHHYMEQSYWVIELVDEDNILFKKKK